jgi:hypothetical protein
VIYSDLRLAFPGWKCINVGELGYDKMFLNMGVLVLVFFGLGLALIGIDRRMGRNSNAAKA